MNTSAPAQKYKNYAVFKNLKHVTGFKSVIHLTRISLYINFYKSVEFILIPYHLCTFITQTFIVPYLLIIK